ncbi:methyltransferase TYW3-domain-containing protein [Dendryphion nanum]|uniref:tRNA wybutosine-synthesizing protein 3 n=1 Tax=Dendryphion nanum TaxID=256645 RepID=A0A9P9DCX5_9PLEO|nr:methyltransferase TYW3-domain-containing protein [Dendryphion nanum]
MQNRFEVKKRRILEQLDTPDDTYQDLSPKGSVDEPIRPLIRDINRLNGLVTTSSCSGRVSVFLEGKKKTVGTLEITQDGEDSSAIAGPGGKGGGSWLYISHDPTKIHEASSQSDLMSLCGMKCSQTSTTLSVDSCFIHLKFEPMILHILTASISESQRVLSAALSAGFRESGAVGLNASKTGELNPMVAIRSTGYSFDAIIGYQDSQGHNIAMVDENYLLALFTIANERFKTNTERIERFRIALLDQYVDQVEGHTCSSPIKSTKADWEDPEVRRQRKKEEGLARQRALKDSAGLSAATFRPESLQSANIDDGN